MVTEVAVAVIMCIADYQDSKTKSSFYWWRFQSQIVLLDTTERKNKPRLPGLGHSFQKYATTMQVAATISHPSGTSPKMIFRARPTRNNLTTQIISG
jgi:hypothetical protein